MSALVLVIEPPGAYRDALLRALAARGARTDTRDDAMEALAIAGELDPNVVLVSDQSGPPDPQSVCRVLQRKLGAATVYRLGDPDFSDPLGKEGRVLPRLSDADAVAAAVLAPDSAEAARGAVEWELAIDPWQLPNLLLALCERRSTGYLLLRAAGVEREIALVRGLPVWARSSVLEERLGEVLLEAGLVAAPDLERARDLARTGDERLGEVLLNAGAIDPHKLYRGLALQLREQLIGACEGPGAQARFVREPALGLHAPLFPFHPLAIAYEAASRIPASTRDTGLARLSGESLAPGASVATANAWLSGLGVRDLDGLLARTDARGLCDALRSTLPEPPDGEPPIDPAALVLALLWCGRIDARIASSLPAVPSIPPPPSQVPAGGWLRVLGAVRPVQLPAPRAFIEPQSDVERALDAYLLAARERPLAYLRARHGALADAAGESPELLRQWCRDEASISREPARTAAAALRAALDGGAGTAALEADAVAARCRRALLRFRLEQLPAETRADRSSERAAARESTLPATRRTSRAAPPPPPPPRSPVPPAPAQEAPAGPSEEDQALFAAAEPLLHQGHWQGVVELLGSRTVGSPLSPRLSLLYAIALKEAPAKGTPGKQNADADLLGLRAVSTLLHVPADSPTALIIGKRVLRKRPIEWQNAPPRRVSLLLTALALLIGAAVGLLFNQRLVDLIWK
jgi:hypothetical protein